MERIITAESFYPSRSTHLVVRERKIFCSDPGWAQEQKYALVVSPLKRPKLNMQFIEKEPAAGSDEVVETWNKLKKIGLPVVRTMRKINDDSVIMTNLSQDGSALFGKYLLTVPESKPESQLVSYFLNIHKLSIKQAACDLADIASNNHVELAEDDAFEVLVHPSGNWELIILDLTNVEINERYSLEHLDEKNGDHLELFFALLDQLRDQLE